MFAQKLATLIVDADCSRFNQHFLQCLSNIYLIWILQTFFPLDFDVLPFPLLMETRMFFLNDFGKTSNIFLCNQSKMLLEKMDEGWVKISGWENYIIIISIFYIISFNRRSRCHPSLICKNIFGSR